MGRMSDMAIDVQALEDAYMPSNEEIIAANIHLALVSICTDVAKAPLDCIDLDTLYKAEDILTTVIQKKLEKRHADNK